MKITPMSDRAVLVLHFIAGVGEGDDLDAAEPFAELLKLGFVRELLDAADGENPYPITDAGIVELAARRDRGALVQEIARGVGSLMRAGQEVTIQGAHVVARLGFEYDVDGEVVASKDVHAHVLAKIETKRAPKTGGFTPRTEPYDSTRTSG